MVEYGNTRATHFPSFENWQNGNHKRAIFGQFHAYFQDGQIKAINIFGWGLMKK